MHQACEPATISSILINLQFKVHLLHTSSHGSVVLRKNEASSGMPLRKRLYVHTLTVSFSGHFLLREPSFCAHFLFRCSLARQTLFARMVRAILAQLGNFLFDFLIVVAVGDGCTILGSEGISELELGKKSYDFMNHHHATFPKNSTKFHSQSE